MDSPGLRRDIYGVDFSGANDAGTRIWIARGVIQQGALLISGCFQAEDLPCSGRDRERSLIALREFIGKQRGGIFGLDFPFGIPGSLVEEKTWGEFVLSFQAIYTSPEEFRKACRVASGGRELKRFTDFEAKTPFSPYNLRLYRQTYFGIRNVLGPLVSANTVCVLPMQKHLADRTWVLEICPASTLKRENLLLSYKGRDGRHRTARQRILDGIQKSGVLKIEEPASRSIVLEDIYGDALDSVIACFAAFRAFQGGFIFDENSPYALEGWVYT